MAWTYDVSLPTDKDKVRWLVGDTDTNDQLIHNEEITFALSDAGSNLYKAAAIVCRAISARLRRELTLDPAAGSVSLDSQKQADGFLALAEKLDEKALTSGAGAGVFAGGISIADKNTREQDSDRVVPAFNVGLHQGSATRLNPAVDDFNS